MQILEESRLSENFESAVKMASNSEMKVDKTSSQVQVDDLIQDGDWVGIRCIDGYAKLHQVKSGTTIRAGKVQIKSDVLIGLPFGCSFRPRGADDDDFVHNDAEDKNDSEKNQGKS